MKAVSSLVESDCWTGSECPAPAAGLSCKVLRTGYDSSGRLVLFTTTLGTDDAGGPQAARNMSRVANKFAEFSGSDARMKDAASGRAFSSAGTLGKFRLVAEVAPADGANQVGTFSVAAK